MFEWDNSCKACSTMIAILFLKFLSIDSVLLEVHQGAPQEINVEPTVVTGGHRVNAFPKVTCTLGVVRSVHLESNIVDLKHA